MGARVAGRWGNRGLDAAFAAWKEFRLERVAAKEKVTLSLTDQFFIERKVVHAPHSEVCTNWSPWCNLAPCGLSYSGH